MGVLLGSAEPLAAQQVPPGASVLVGRRTVTGDQPAEASYAVARDVPWIVSNMDLAVPRKGGITPGNGALATAGSPCPEAKARTRRPATG